MPTKRPRVTVTETPVLARRLDLAAARFPERADSRRELLLALTEIAERALLRDSTTTPDRGAAKRRVLLRTGAITESDAEAMLAARDADWRADDQ